MGSLPPSLAFRWLLGTLLISKSVLHCCGGTDVAGGGAQGWLALASPRLPLIPQQTPVPVPLLWRLRGGMSSGNDEATLDFGGDGDGCDIEDAVDMGSLECRHGGTPVQHKFLTPSALHDLEASIRRKTVRNPKDHYVYNRTAGRWDRSKWDPVALPGEDQFHRMFWQRRHPMIRTARRANETLEEFVRRCPCWPPYCRKCPLRPTPSLTASALALHERITGNKHNVSLSLRCDAAPPFSPEAAQDLGGYCPPRSGA